jgi:hypothetical protein
MAETAELLLVMGCFGNRSVCWVVAARVSPLKWSVNSQNGPFPCRSWLLSLESYPFPSRKVFFLELGRMLKPLGTRDEWYDEMLGDQV